MAKLRVVNFGTSKGGLSTIGYTVYGPEGNVLNARSTSGVVEIGTATGIYAAKITLPDYDAIVLWDTGEATPRYSTEDFQYQLTSIESAVEPIQKIYNSIRNQGDFLATLMDKLGLLQKNEGLQKVNEKLDLITRKGGELSLTNIAEAFSRAASGVKLPAPIVNIPKTNIPDYTPQILELSRKLSAIMDYIIKLQQAQERISSLSVKLEQSISKTGLDRNVISELKRLNQMLYMLSSSNVVKDFQEANNMIAAFGHKRK